MPEIVSNLLTRFEHKYLKLLLESAQSGSTDTIQVVNLDLRIQFRTFGLFTCLAFTQRPINDQKIEPSEESISSVS